MSGSAAPSAKPPLALVFGASGYVGSNLVPALQAAAVRVRAAARNRKVLEARAWRDVELVEADALAPATLAPALDGVDVAYYLVHSMASGRDFGRLDLEAASNFARAAAAAGVRRIVYLGGLVPPGADSEHLVSRKETGDRLRAGPVPVTEIRAGIIVGPGSAAYEVMRDLVYHLPLMVTPKWVQSRSSPIALPNLLHYLIAVAARPEAEGHDLRRRRPGDPVLRRDDARVRRGRRPTPADPAGPGALAQAVVVLAGPRHRGAGQHRAGADRRAQARHPAPTTRSCARWCRSACSRSARRSRPHSPPSAPTRSPPAGPRAR